MPKDFEVLTGTILRVLDGLVTSVTLLEDGKLLTVGLSNSEELKIALKSYVKHVNKKKKIAASVSFPKPFQIVLRQGPEKTEKAKRLRLGLKAPVDE